MSGAGDEFQVVTRKKWMARKCLSRRNRHKSESDYLNDCPDVNVDNFQTRLERICGEMSQSDYFIVAMETLQQQLDSLKRPLERIVCLGLGPFTRTHQALHQTAFIVSVQRQHNIKEALYYDPVFRDSEKELLQRLNGTVMSEDCAGRHEAEVPTLYYLPHCPYALMHNLLWCNWQRERLPNVLLICNSFEMLTLNRTKNTDDDHINRISEHCSEIALEDDYEQHNVFNDLSLHTFSSDKLPAAEDTVFWTRCAPLKVNEDELIKEVDMAALSIGS
ncbi:SRR1-like protein [Drosophila sulfurigaster albostrigata]|uniref:SRR1-like protein n=1 Tax=Drosophila sulfurigaster albostrigata TaxID=89887 RepID=UPI002D21BA6B|nr:SRR1-like protein [Drosophila sulfurigaster albostrigata]